jgi:hypothetical protein
MAAGVRMTQRLLAILLACLVLPPLARAGKEPGVYLESRTGCLAEQGIDQRLGAVLERHGAADHLSLTVADAPAASGVLVTLRAIWNPSGEVVLERRFDLLPGDCPSVGDLVVLVLEQFLDRFPLEERIEAARPEPPPAPPPALVTISHDVAALAGSAMLSLDSRWPTPGADLELGAAFDVGSSRHRLVASAAVRVGLPHALGGGHYIESLGLLGVGWRYAAPDWMLRLELRSGGLLVAGFGYRDNYHRWLLWLEAQACMLWEWNGVMLGPLVAISPLWHDVEATGEVRSLPWLRVGLVLGLPFWTEKF